MKDQPLRSIDDVMAEIAGKSIEELRNEPWEGPPLISVDALRAAGALDVPAAWRKSLGGGDKGLFDESFDDEAAAPNERHQPQVEAEPDELAD